MNSKAKAQISRFCWKSSGLVHWVMRRSNISDSFSTNYFYLFSNKRVSRVSEQKFVLGQPGILEFKWVSEFWILSWELTLKKKSSSVQISLSRRERHGLMFEDLVVFVCSLIFFSVFVLACFPFKKKEKVCQLIPPLPLYVLFFLHFASVCIVIMKTSALRKLLLFSFKNFIDWLIGWFNFINI